MTKLILEIELDYDAAIMHDDDEDGRRWFFEDILRGDDLTLFASGDLGDTVGKVRVLSIKPGKAEL